MDSFYNRPAVTATQKTKWDGTYTTVNSNSANWDSSYTNLGNISFNGTTITTTVTGTGQFMTLTINGSAFAIQLNIY